MTIMKDLKGTKTEANLQTAFAGESMAATNTHIMLQRQRRTDTFR